MSDIELVIKIDEEVYQEVVTNERWRTNLLGILCTGVENGTLLPKEHGKLVDANSIPKEDRNITVKSLLYPGTIAFAGAINLEEYVNSLPTIIAADEVESEDKG